MTLSLRKGGLPEVKLLETTITGSGAEISVFLAHIRNIGT